MSVSSFLALLVLALMGAIAALNWSMLSTPLVLTLGFLDTRVSLGLLLAAVAAAVGAIFLLYIAVQQAGFILHSRTSARALRTQRELADQAEASRIVELRTFLETELRADDCMPR